MRDEKGPEGGEGGQDQADLGRYELPIDFPDAVHDAVILEAAGADQRDGNQDNGEAQRQPQGQLLAPSDLNGPDQTHGDEKYWRTKAGSDGVGQIGG